MSEEKFTHMKNGYNRFQVDDYVSRTNKKISDMELLMKKHDQEFQELREQYRTLVDTHAKLVENISGKEHAYEQMTSLAIKESNQIIHTAKQNSEWILKDALASAKAILAEISQFAEATYEQKATMYEDVKRIEEAIDTLEVVPLPSMDVLKRNKQ